MTIEIRELVIRAVADAPGAGQARPGRPEPAVGPDLARHDAPIAAAEGDALVARCVREVLRELRKTRAR